MSSKDFGSIDGLNQAGRAGSRSNLVSSSSSVDDVLDKLKYMNYHVEFCKQNNLHPLHKFQLLYPDSNPNEQFFTFSLLFAWLVTKAGVVFDKPGQFDDPNATCANMGITYSYSRCSQVTVNIIRFSAR
jgi:hypothetical protein